MGKFKQLTQQAKTSGCIINQFTAEHLWITIFMKPTEHWPRNQIGKQVVEKIQQKQYKLTYTLSIFSYDDILYLLEHDDILLPNCYEKVDLSKFKKTRHRLIDDRSPPTQVKATKYNN